MLSAATVNEEILFVFNESGSTCAKEMIEQNKK
jgi:hypothetical protein